jgi:hypothetical protein
MTFDLIGFDFSRAEEIYGFWIGNINDWKEFNNALFCIHRSQGEWRFDLLWHKIIGG